MHANWGIILLLEQQTIAHQIMVIFGGRLLDKLLAARVVGSIDLSNAEVERTRNTVNQTNPDTSNLLAHHIALRLDNHAVVRTDELADGKNDSLPFARRLSVQTVLVEIGRHDRFGLNIDEVFASVALDLESNVAVWVEVPESFAKQGTAHISCAPGGVSRTLNLGPVCRKLV